MIAEVNNTFNERRIYFIPPHQSPRDRVHLLGPEGSMSAWFQSVSFEKDFHVSPFSSRKGTYTVTARNLLQYPSKAKDEPPGRYDVPLDIKVRLCSSQNFLKLYARTWCSQNDVLDPENLSYWDVVRIIWVWLRIGRMPCELSPQSYLKLL